MTIETAPVPHRDYDGYRSCMIETLELPPSQWAFKSDPRYRQILEHVTPDQAMGFLGHAKLEFPEIWDAVQAELPGIIRDNDRLGQPAKEFRVFADCSPSNMRYLFHGLMTLKEINRHGQDSVHVVELGGGYGGLALYVQRLKHLFKTRVLSYTIVDVPEATALQAAIAEVLGLPLRVVNGLDPQELETAVQPADGVQRFLVSAYAFSEFRAQFQAWYTERLVRHCAHGFMVWNYDQYWDNPIYAFVDGPMEVVPERPLIASGNSFVSF